MRVAGTNRSGYVLARNGSRCGACPMVSLFYRCDGQIVGNSVACWALGCTLANPGRGLLWLGLSRWAQFLPQVPEGDMVVVAEAGARASAILGAALERMETVLRRWPVACLSLLIVAIILGALMLWG
jgi:hypothetical protein